MLLCAEEEPRPGLGHGQNACFAPKRWLCLGAPYTATQSPWGSTQKSGEFAAQARSSRRGGAGGLGAGTAGGPSWVGQEGSLRMSHVSMFLFLHQVKDERVREQRGVVRVGFVLIN